MASFKVESLRKDIVSAKIPLLPLSSLLRSSHWADLSIASEPQTKYLESADKEAVSAKAVRKALQVSKPSFLLSVRFSRVLTLFLEFDSRNIQI